MDPLSASFVTFGVLCLLISWFYLLIVSFKNDYSWGLTTLFAPPLSYLYSFWALEKAGAAVGFAFLGCILIFLGL